MKRPGRPLADPPHIWASPGPEPLRILARGEVSEWLMVPLSKSGVVDSHRGFESRPLRGFVFRLGAWCDAFCCRR